jgi:hypothetical protein
MVQKKMQMVQKNSKMVQIHIFKKNHKITAVDGTTVGVTAVRNNLKF